MSGASPPPPGSCVRPPLSLCGRDVAVAYATGGTASARACMHVWLDGEHVHRQRGAAAAGRPVAVPPRVRLAWDGSRFVRCSPALSNSARATFWESAEID